MAKTVTNNFFKKQCNLKGMYTIVFCYARKRREWVTASEAWLHRSFDDGFLKEILAVPCASTIWEIVYEIQEICGFASIPNGIFAG